LLFKDTVLFATRVVA